MSKEAEIATIVWLLALALALPASWYVGTIVPISLIVASTINLWHQRRIRYHAGEIFTRRVKEVLAEDIAVQRKELAELRIILQDVKETQVRIGGSFMGSKQR